MSEQNKIDEITAALAAATPGPWEHMNAYDVFTLRGVTNREGIKANENDGWHICEVNCSPTFVGGDELELVDLKHHEKKANAQLIAKAPEYITYLLQEIERRDKALEWANRIIGSGVDVDAPLRYDPQYWLLQYHEHIAARETL